MDQCASGANSFVGKVCHFLFNLTTFGKKRALSAREELFEERNSGEEEFCTECLTLMGFSKRCWHDDPIRSLNGAEYGPGGQTCAKCVTARAMKERSCAEQGGGT